MKEIILPSDEALLARSDEINASRLEQDKATWQAKIDELEASRIAIEQQMAALRTQADSGDYGIEVEKSISQMSNEEIELEDLRQRQRVQRRERMVGRIENIRRDLGYLGLHDNEPVMHRYLAPRRWPGEDGPHPKQGHVNEILCVQGDTIMYAEQWLGRLGEFESYELDPETVLGAKVDIQNILSPSFATTLPVSDGTRVFSRRNAYLTNVDADSYVFGYDDIAIESIERAIPRLRVNRLMESAEALLSESGEYCKLKHGDPYPSGRSSWREQTYALSSEATVAVGARYETYLQQDPAYKELESNFPKPYDGEDINHYYERAGINDYHKRALEAYRASFNIPHKHLKEVIIRHIDTAGTERYIILNKEYLDIERKTLTLKEAESLIAQITEEKV